MFESFLANEQLKGDLSRLITEDRLPHAIALCGKVGMGAGFLARLVAKEYLKDTAGLCLRDVHPDCILLKGSGTSGEIAVDDVRDAIYEMNKAAVTANGRRVLLISHAENLNASSGNALLKLLEEPPAGVLMLLTVQKSDDLMETIRSRVRFYHLEAPSEDQCARFALQRVPACSEQRAAELSRLYGGRVGLVLRALTDAEFACFGDAAGKFCDAALKGSRYDAMVYLASAEKRPELITLLECAAVYLGSLIKSQPQTAAKTGYLLQNVEDTIAQLKQSANVKLAATNLCLAAVQKG